MRVRLAGLYLGVMEAGIHQSLKMIGPKGIARSWLAAETMAVWRNVNALISNISVERLESATLSTATIFLPQLSVEQAAL